MHKVVTFMGALLLFLSLNGQTVITLHLPLPCTETSIATHFSANPLELEVYPNPSSGEITLLASGQEALGALFLEISSIQGKTLITEHFTAPESQFSKTLDLKNLAAGIYMLKLSSKEAVVTQKIIIQK